MTRTPEQAIRAYAYGPTSLEVPAHFTPEQTLAVLREIEEGIAAFNRWAARQTPKVTEG